MSTKKKAFYFSTTNSIGYEIFEPQYFWDYQIFTTHLVK